MAALLKQTPFGKRLRFIANKDGKAGVEAGALDRLWEAMYEERFGAMAVAYSLPEGPLLGDADGSYYLKVDFKDQPVAPAGGVGIATVEFWLGPKENGDLRKISALYDSSPDAAEQTARAFAAMKDAFKAFRLVPFAEGTELRMVPRPGQQLELNLAGIGSQSVPTIDASMVIPGYPLEEGGFVQVNVPAIGAGNKTPVDLAIRTAVDFGAGPVAAYKLVKAGASDAGLCAALRESLQPLLPAGVEIQWYDHSPATFRLAVTAAGVQVVSFSSVIGKP